MPWAVGRAAEDRERGVPRRRICHLLECGRAAACTWPRGEAAALGLLRSNCPGLRSRTGGAAFPRSMSPKPWHPDELQSGSFATDRTVRRCAAALQKGARRRRVAQSVCRSHSAVRNPISVRFLWAPLIDRGWSGLRSKSRRVSTPETRRCQPSSVRADTCAAGAQEFSPRCTFSFAKPCGTMHALD
jgi:hypothetical protein